jgi:hypothetical protein
MTVRKFATFIMLFCLFAGFVACAPSLEPMVTERPSPTAEVVIEKVGVPTAVPLPHPTKNVKLFQYDSEPTFARPEQFVEYGRLPFTLYNDGTLIYEAVDDVTYQHQAMAVQLSRDEVEGLLTQLFVMGLAELESYTDDCRPIDEEMTECVADAGYTILRYWQPEGQREIKIYAEFVDDPQVLQAILRFLWEYEHAKARTYLPQAATLFLGQIDEPVGVEVLAWPLSSGWFDNVPRTGYDPAPYLLQGEELEVFLSAVPFNMGDFYFQFEDSYYHAYLVPWLPDSNYTQEIRQ